MTETTTPDEKLAEKLLRASSKLTMAAIDSFGWMKPGTLVNLQVENLEGSEGTPAWYIPSTGNVHLNLTAFTTEGEGAMYDRDKTISDIARSEWSTDRAKRVLGFLAHEAAHSRWSDWMTAVDKGAIKGLKAQIVTLFEELRIEKRATDKGGAEYLRHSFRWLLEKFLADGDPSTKPLAVAHTWALTYGRYTAGIATFDEVSPIDTVARVLLSDNVVDMLRDILDEAVEAKSMEAAWTLPMLAQEWIDLLVDEDDEDEDGGGGGGMVIVHICDSEDRLGVSESQSGEGDESGEETEGAGKPGDEGADGEKGIHMPGGHGKGPESNPEGAELLKETIEIVAESMGKPFDPDAVVKLADPRKMAPIFTKPPVATQVAPSPLIRAKAKRLAKTLEQLSLPSISKLTIPSAIPPGRLRGREMVRQGAERAQGRMVTATPWERTKRQRTTTKPIIVGCMTDTSGSMSWAQDFVAEFAWVTATAGIHVGARTAAVTFGDYVSPVTKPGEVPSMLNVYAANGGSEAFDQAAAALDSVLHLSIENGASKVLFVVSDGHLVNYMETEKAQKWVKLFQRGGTKVVWLAYTAGNEAKTYPGVVFVPKGKPEAMYAQLESAIVKAAK